MDRRGAAVVVAVGAVFVGVSLAWELDLTRTPYVLPLQLGTELSPAAWWSGTLLLLAALGAVQRSYANVHAARRGWLALGSLLAIMSLSEIGSVHERLGKVWLVPYVLLLGGLFVFALTRFWAARGPIRVVVVVAASFGVLAVTTLQEHAKGYGTAFDDVPLLPVGLEEAAEVLAFTAILLAIMAARPPMPGQVGVRSPLPAVTASRSARRLAGGLLAAHLLYSVLVAPSVEIGQHGDLAVWFPSAAFVWLALRRLQDVDLSRTARLLGAAVATAGSVGAVVLLSPAALDRLDTYGVPVDGRWAWTVVLLAAVVMFWGRNTGALVTGLGAVSVLLVAAFDPGPAAHYAVAGIVAGVPIVAAVGDVASPATTRPRRAVSPVR